MKHLFSNRELRHAAALVGESLLSELPPPSACDHEFSEQFKTDMATLLGTAHKREVRILVLRRVAAAVLALLIGASVFLALNPTTRAAIGRWLREVYENQIIYYFKGEDADSPLPDCEIGWIPEGYEQENAYRNPVFGNAIFYNTQHDLLTVEYTKMSDSIVHSVMFDHPECVVSKSVFIGGCPGDLYLFPDGSESSILVWQDETMNVQFTIYGTLSEAELLKIAESIKIK